jgi:phospholipid/cholesterol/gamma-HCH transport system ATP-binding protein
MGHDVDPAGGPHDGAAPVPAIGPRAAAPGESLVQVRGVTMRHDGELVQRDLDFDILAGEVFAIVGPSGCGKSTLLRHLIGLQEPAAGQVLYGGCDLYHCSEEEHDAIRRRFGVMFQAGALWSTLTVGENLMLPMRLFTRWDRRTREQRARFKLALVGLHDCFDDPPAALSGGMRKRVAIARALALDPTLLYLDEPASGLDPLNAARLDELIVSLRRHLGTTVVMVTHSIDSLFAVADRVLFLDAQERTMTALDSPRGLLAHGPERVRAFLHREVPA